MKKVSGRKVLGLALALALLVNLFAVGASASLGDGNMQSIDIDLAVGTGSGASFSALPAGAAPVAGDVLTVRMYLTNDFWAGSSRLVTLFSKEFFSLVIPGGVAKDAYVPNTANPFYASVIADYSVTPAIPNDTPFKQVYGNTNGPLMFAQYTASTVSLNANSNAANGGYPGMMNGEWMFEIQLNVLKNLTPGCGARIFMDGTWLRNPDHTSFLFWFNKCASDSVLSTSGSSTTYYFDLNLEGADITLPAAAAQSTVAFETGEGSAIAPLTGNVGDPVPAVTDPVRVGYTFTGWDQPYPATFPAGGLTLTAGWSVNTYYANFYVDGSLFQAVPTQFGAVILPPGDPVKTGHTFTGWDSIPATMPANDVDINATFDVNTYNANFYVDGALYAAVPTAYGAVIAPPADPDKLGYTFTGWDPIPTTMPDHDVDINATFDINVYDAKFYVDGTLYATVPTAFGGVIAPPADPVKLGHDFTGWDTIPAAMPANDIIIDAVFSANTYDAEFYVDGALYATVPTAFGAAISPPADPAKFGYTFTGWDPVPGVMDSEGAVFHALFEQDAYSVFFAEFDNVYFGGYFTPMTVKVYGSPTQIQFYNLSNGATVTYIRDVNPNILSVQGYDQFGDPVAAGSPDLAYETWVINVRLSETDYVVRAKFPAPEILLNSQLSGAQPNIPTLFEPVGESFPLTVVFQDTQYVSCVIDNATPAKGTPMVFTVVTTMDVPKIQFVTPGGSTLTYHINYAVYTDDIVTGMRTWTVTRTASVPGATTWTLRGCVANVWSDTGLSVAFTVV